MVQDGVPRPTADQLDAADSGPAGRGRRRTSAAHSFRLGMTSGPARPGQVGSGQVSGRGWLADTESCDAARLPALVELLQRPEQVDGADRLVRVADELGVELLEPLDVDTALLLVFRLPADRYESESERDGQTDKRTDRQTDRRTDGQTDGQTDRRTDGQTTSDK